MELALFKLFGEEREERSIIVMLLLQSFILGIYYGVFNVAAHAIFLARYDETDMARAYIISGITGIALTYLYSLLRSGRHFSRLSMLNLVLIFLVSLFLWISIRRSTEPWVIFGVFVMLGPLFLMSMTGIRDTSQRLLEGHRGARSNALIDTGLISGCMAGSFFVPLLLSAGTHLHNMLFVSAAGMLVAMLIQYELIRKQKAKLDRLKYSYQKSPVYSLLKDNKYIQSVFLFIVLSVLVAFFVQYSFMAVTRLRYPGENEMATFLGFFEGGMMAFSLLVYTFLFSFILKNHGLKITLALKPVLIALFVLFISVTGLSGGAVQGSQGFFLFFVLLALTRLFSRALNMTIEKPSLKILYHSLTEKARYNIKHAFDGTVNETAVLLSGLLLTGLAALAFIKLVHFSLLLIIISISWTLVALRLYKRYRETIKESLEERRKDVKDESIHAMHKEFSSTSSSGFFIDNNYFEVITSPELHEHIIDNRLILSQVINKAERYPNPNILPLLKNIMP
ncbi:MAG: hypothetical protein KFF49_03445, partial [Bacteroidales bacterium]|nr:hypothetical protein [Bacteroidales bacterium]